MRACEGSPCTRPFPSQKPTVVVQHADLVTNPYGAVTKLYNDLTAAGVSGLTLPAEDKVLKLIRPSTKKTDFYLRAERNTVGMAAQMLSDTLSRWSPEAAAQQVAPANWLMTPRKANEAFATLLTTDNADYLRGALVLGSSIRTFDSSRDMVALVTERVPTEWHASLEVAGWTVHVVPELEEFW